MKKTNGEAHGYNLLLTLAVHEKTGAQTQVQAIPMTGSWPRALNLSPDGHFPVCFFLADDITVYRVDSDGLLTDSGHHGFAKGAGGVRFFDPNT